MAGETDLDVLLATMEPQLHHGAYEFVTTANPTGTDLADAAVVVREAEGVTLVRPVASSPAGVMPADAMAWITLTVHSSLQAVGLTAAVATTLAAHGIACNVVAGFHHDHLFVPFDRGDDAVRALSRPAGALQPFAPISADASVMEVLDEDRGS